MLTSAQITLRTETGMHISDVAPTGPSPDQLWLDTGQVPNALYRWDGSDWVLCGVDIDLENYYTKSETNTLFEQTDQAISLKADSSTVSALTTRVTSAEQKITPTAIVSTVRASAQYQYDLNYGRNYVLMSDQSYTFVDNYYRYPSGSTSTYTGITLSVSKDLYEHSGQAANLRLSFEIKRTNVVAASNNAYSGIWIYYDYVDTDGVTKTTGRGWLLRDTDTDFASTDSDWVWVTKGVLNLTSFSAIGITNLTYGTSTSAGTTGTVVFRNAKVEVSNTYTRWSPAPEDLGALPGRLTSAESSITQNANNIALKVSESVYNQEKIYRSNAAPTSPT